MSFFSVPLSGLTASQDELQAVSNNLANINTDGYKDQKVSFSDIFQQTSTVNGSGDPLQTGAGVKVAGTDANFSDGAPNPTGIPSNMALSGNGFFVTQSASGLPDYTRAGNFTQNSSGQLVTPNGDLVLGYPAVNGVVSTAAALQPLQVGSTTISAASATSSFQISQNLSSSAAVGDTANSVIPAFDSLGSSHILNIQYTKTGTNAWSYNITLPAADTGGTGSPTSVATGSLAFSSSGVLTAPTGSISPISITGLADGAAPITLAWRLNDGAGSPTITQTNSASATSATSQNGYASGTLQSYTVQPDGTIQGSFSNEKTLALGQVAVAIFANNQGLSHVGNSNYQATAASGSAVIGLAGAGGRGTILGGNVEQSNVDIASEFAKLIVAQQAYQANAKAITTFNTVSQATIALIA